MVVVSDGALSAALHDATPAKARQREQLQPTRNLYCRECIGSVAELPATLFAKSKCLSDILGFWEHRFDAMTAASAVIYNMHQNHRVDAASGLQGKLVLENLPE